MAMIFKVMQIFYSNVNAEKFKVAKQTINVPSSLDLSCESPTIPYPFFRAAETRTLDMTSLWNPQLNEDCSYFVFVTFVEIYNNYIYDLFDDDILNK